MWDSEPDKPDKAGKADQAARVAFAASAAVVEYDRFYTQAPAVLGAPSSAPGPLARSRETRCQDAEEGGKRRGTTSLSTLSARRYRNTPR